MKSISLLTTVAVISSVAFAEETAPVAISVSKEGGVALSGRSMTLDELAQHLSSITKDGKKPEVVITSSQEAPQKVTTAVIDACRKCGLNKFRIQNH